MYTRIMIPVDLAHKDQLTKAIRTGADLARHYKAPVTFVGVTGVQPTPAAHSPEEYSRKLDAFAKAEAEAHGIEATAKTIVAHDPMVETDRKLADAVKELEADLVVMGSHIPRAFEFGSHGGALASHSSATVMLVRGD
ncbi:MAG: universal stress protein [Pseudomonadota bacterium]